MKILNYFVSFVDNINEKVGRFASFFIVGMIVPILIEVVARYIFNKPTIWAHELSLMFFGAFWIFGSGYTLLLRGHVNMDILHNRLSPRKKAIMDVITSICFFTVCIILLKHGIDLAERAWAIYEHSESLWSPAVYPIKTVLPIGIFLLLLQGVAKFIRDLSFAITGREVIAPSRLIQK